jgi:RNA recognition motif-containing protein
MKLLVRNLARSTTEAELKEMFEAFGRVQSCNLVMDQKSGTSKGFGFVEMPKPGEAKAAMKNLNGKDVAGNKIRVKKAEDRPADPRDPAAPRESAAPQPEPEQKKPRPTLKTRADKAKPKPDKVWKTKSRDEEAPAAPRETEKNQATAPKKTWPKKSGSKQEKPWKGKPKQERSERPRAEESEPEKPKSKSPVNPWQRNK